MPKLNSRSYVVAEYIRDRKPFKTHGALSAETVTRGLTAWYSGRLSGPDLERFREDASDVDYVVLSYVTPIAWHTPRGWYKVTQKFSLTTTHHQGKLYLV